MISSMTMLLPINSRVLLLITKSAMRSVSDSCSRSWVLICIGSTEMIAGSRTTENTNAASTPAATTFPSSLNGGTSLLFILRKPMAVVRLVTNTGFRLIRNASRIAACLSRPRRISLNIVDRICTLSAMARVMIITGATAVGEVIIIPR